MEVNEILAAALEREVFDPLRPFVEMTTARTFRMAAP